MYEVLIVEDDPMVAMINKQYVTENPHFHVAGVCRDGASALAFLEKTPVHLLILDLYMPRTDGLTLLRQVRERQIPVSAIMVTAANDALSVEEALRLGVVDYLVKPFNGSRFQQALGTFLRRQDAFHDLSALDQQQIDSLIAPMPEKSASELPKGNQDQTLSTICRFLQEHPAQAFPGEAIADQVGLSRVTVRRYLNYLSEENAISSQMNYETGGRPCMLYRWNR